MNDININSSEQRARNIGATQVRGTWDPATRQELGNSVSRTTAKAEPSNERQRTFEAGN